MNDQSKGMKILYTLFLLAITANTVLNLYDRFGPKEKCHCKEKDNG